MRASSAVVMLGIIVSSQTRCQPESSSSPRVDTSGGSDAGGAASGGISNSGGEGGTPSGDGGGTVSSGGSEVGGASPCENSLPLRTQAPPTLEQTGFFEQESGDVAGYLRQFEPRFALWSDGAEKTRWLYLPECDGVIDTSDMDDWRFPVGTYSFKRFEVDGEPVETRMIHKYGPDDDEVLYATYVWDAEMGASVLDNNGHTVPRAEGADYEVPNVAAGHCSRCHGPSESMSVGLEHGLPSRFLGANAVDLNRESDGLTLKKLERSGALSAPPSPNQTVPGEPNTVQALGYLHANCGYCHNDSSLGQQVGTDYVLRLGTDDQKVEETSAYQTAVNVTVSGYSSLEPVPCSHRVFGGDLALSCIFERMGLRGTNQMPPLDTHRVDAAGMATVEAWILSLPAP